MGRRSFCSTLPCSQSCLSALLLILKRRRCSPCLLSSLWVWLPPPSPSAKAGIPPATGPSFTRAAIAARAVCHPSVPCRQELVHGQPAIWRLLALTFTCKCSFVQAASGSFRSALAASPTQGGRHLTHCHQSPAAWHLWVAASASLARQQVDSFQVEAWLACPTKQRRRRMGCLFERVSLSAPEAM